MDTADLSHDAHEKKHAGTDFTSIHLKDLKGETETDNDDVESQPPALTLPASDEQQKEKDAAEDETEYPPLKKVIVASVALFISMFLVALDRTIIATAIPRMTDEFNSFADIGWYGSAYLLPMACCQLLFGKVYTFYNPKTVFLIMVFLFEVGSALCGAAPSSIVFIIGRVIAGLASSGIMSGIIIVLTRIVPLRKRPSFMGCFGAVFGIASVVGPLLGGVFTTEVSWRWCFYINLPIGAVALVILMFILEIPEGKKKIEVLTFSQKLRQLDPIGTSFFVPGIVCLLLALQWGGGTYAWSNWRIILCFVLFGIAISFFVGIQVWKKDKATVPPRVIKQRSILAAFIFTILTGGGMMLITYYAPLWLQAIRGESAVASGITLIPMLISLVVAAGCNGGIVQKSGYYVPSMITCSVITSIGAGLFVTLKVTTSRAMFIGFEVLFGFGLGCGLQQAALAAQTVLPTEFVPVGVSVIMFAQSLGGSVFVSVGQNVLNNQLIKSLSRLPGFDARSVINVGATDIVNVVPAQYLPQVLEAYNNAITDIFKVMTGISCLSLLAAVAMEWKSIKGKPKMGGA